MNKARQSIRLLLIVLFSLATVISSSRPTLATIGNIVKSDLAGTWQIALRGTTGCGNVSVQANITLNTAGSGTGTLRSHGECGDSTLTGQSFTITSLKSNGSGTASLSCGSACGWGFDIQVAPDRSKFNLVDVSNPGNFLEGVAILASPAGDIVTPDLTGSWQVTLSNQGGGCGTETLLVTFTLNSSGTTNNAAETDHAPCGNTDGTGTFTIQSLNSNGSGTAVLNNCLGICGLITFNIQVSPDRSTFNLVDVSDPGNFWAGVAINNSTAAAIVKANLAGAWQVALNGYGGCLVASTLVTFTLNSSGTANNAAETSHSVGCGNTHTTGNTFTIQSLSSNGSGTAGLTCGVGCGFTFSIQVSPDRSTFNLVDLTDGGTSQVGTAIHQ